MGYFEDGDLSALPNSDRDILRAARDRVMDIPAVALLNGLCPPAAYQASYFPAQKSLGLE
jgi:hypothetical protein